MICLAPRAPGDSVRPRRLSGVVVRPLNFTVRGLEMNHRAAALPPSEVKWGLRLAWASLLVNVLTTMCATISSTWPAGHSPWDGASLSIILLISLSLLFTPSFVGFWLTAIALFFLARRKGWIRWLLLIGAVIGVCFFIFNVDNRSTSVSVMATTPFVILRAFLLVAYSVSIALLFMRTSNAWFDGRSHGAL